MEKQSMADKRKEAAAEAAKKLHSGKWTLEEEAYVAGLMEAFRDGILDVQDGTTLRSFLATKLNCKPKRISKKYEGKNYDGKQLYWKTEDDISPQEIRTRLAHLDRLEAKFKECLQAIELVKASRGDGSSVAPSKADDQVSLADDHAVVATPAAASLSPLSLQKGLISSPSPVQTARGSTGSPAMTPAGLDLLQSRFAMQQRAAPHQDLYRTGAASAADATATFLARQRQLEAMEFAAGNPLFRNAPHQAVASAPSPANLSALLGQLGNLPRPTSPQSMGFALNRSTSPLEQQASNTSFLEQAAALEQQARQFRNMAALSQAAAAPSVRPPTHTHFHHHHGIGGGMRRPSGNQMAAAQAYEESLMMQRLQQPVVRDLGLYSAAGRTGSLGGSSSGDCTAPAGATNTNNKRMLSLEELQKQQQHLQSQMNKRQRFV